MRGWMTGSGIGWRRFGAAHIVSALILALPAQAQWFRADTDHFTIYAEDSAQKAVEYAQQLERFQALTLTLLGLPEDGARTRRRFEVIVVRDQEQLSKVDSRVHGNMIGYYAQCSEGTMALAALRTRKGESSDDQAREVIFHEVAHRLMFEHLGAKYPRWFIEGFAEYMSLVRVGTARRLVIVGDTPDRRLRAVAAAKDFPFAKVLTAVEPDAETDAHFYARSWALTHYLLSDETLTQSLNTYLERISNGEDRVGVFESVIGRRVHMLAKYVDEHVSSARPIWSGLSAAHIAAPRVEVRELAEHHGEVILFDAALRSCTSPSHGQTVLAELRRLRAKRREAVMELRLALARAELYWGDLAAAKSELEAALLMEPESFAVHHLLGRTLAKQALALVGEAREAQVDAAKEHLFKAARINKEDAPNNYQIALLPWVDQRDVNRLTAARNAQALEPTVVEYALLLAFIELEAGRRERAIKALRPIAANPHQPKLSSLMRRAIELIEKGRGVLELNALLAVGS